jgi:hypothetical protein
VRRLALGQRPKRFLEKGRMMGHLVTLAVALFGGISNVSEPTASQGKGEPCVIELKAQRVSPQTAKKLAARARSEETEEVYVGIGGTCHVDSRVDVWIDVYINGRYRGRMPPWGDIYPFVGDPAGATTSLYAVSTCGRYRWGPVYVSGNYSDYHWILWP